MRRVLAPGGRLAVATWRPLDDAPFFNELGAVAVARLGPILDQRHAFGVAADLEALLTDAGFHDVRVETITRTITFAESAALLQLNATALVGMSQASKTMDEAERARQAALIAADSAEVVSKYRDGAGLAFELGTNVATGRA
jgi:hypothetical protein